MPGTAFTPDFQRLKALLQGRGHPVELLFFEWYFDPDVAPAAADRFFERPDSQVYNTADAYGFECGVRLALLLRLHNLPYCACQKIMHMVPKPDAREPAGDFGAEAIDWDRIRLGPFGVGSSFDMVDWQGGIALASHRYLERAHGRLPDGMKLSVGLPGIMEVASAILGNEEFYTGFYTAPEWMEEFLRRIGEATVKAADEITQFPASGCLVLADDMGARTGLLVSPDTLRKYVLPVHGRCVEVAHSRDIPVILHSCGNVLEIMDDLIRIGIDAKQSFDDIALPVERFKQTCGDRVVTLGGLDVTILSGKDQEAVRNRTRRVMQSCWGDGRYALGSGHCLATYTPVESFLAMQDEAMRYADAAD